MAEPAAAEEEPAEELAEEPDAPATPPEEPGQRVVASLPRLDGEDILEDDGGAPAAAAFDTDLHDTTDTSQYVYVQHPLTKRVSRRRNEEVLRDRERTAGQREELGARAQTDSVGEAMEAIDHVTATAFLFCQSIYAGVALLALVMSAASDDFVAYYSPLASVCRKVTMFLGSLCILAAVEKHGRGGAVGWAGGGWLRSVAVMSLYSLSFLLTLLNTPMVARPLANVSSFSAAFLMLVSLCCRTTC